MIEHKVTCPYCYEVFPIDGNENAFNHVLEKHIETRAAEVLLEVMVDG